MSRLDDVNSHALFGHRIGEKAYRNGRRFSEIGIMMTVERKAWTGR
jgi:hypothetical protein